ncbi:MAG: hypothetical protein LBI69_02405 [Puniceicoccales bacterium]|jgi:phosphatidylinositol-4,5-bisphosphate 4-phosphatase|nr:hypothetical protein [Puniceicoccales bacterium]
MSYKKIDSAAIIPSGIPNDAFHHENREYGATTVENALQDAKNCRMLPPNCRLESVNLEGKHGLAKLGNKCMLIAHGSVGSCSSGIISLKYLRESYGQQENVLFPSLPPETQIRIIFDDKNIAQSICIGECVKTGHKTSVTVFGEEISLNIDPLADDTECLFKKLNEFSGDNASNPCNEIIKLLSCGGKQKLNYTQKKIFKSLSASFNFKHTGKLTRKQRIRASFIISQLNGNICNSIINFKSYTITEKVETLNEILKSPLLSYAPAFKNQVERLKAGFERNICAFSIGNLMKYAELCKGCVEKFDSPSVATKVKSDLLSGSKFDTTYGKVGSRHSKSPDQVLSPKKYRKLQNKLARYAAKHCGCKSAKNFIETKLITQLEKDENAWNIKTGKVEIAHGKFISLTSTPAAKMETEKNKKIFEGLTGGISSYNRASNRAINLWETKIDDESNLCQFRALRHGNTRGINGQMDDIGPAFIALAMAKNNDKILLLNSAQNKVVDEKKVENLKSKGSSKDNPLEISIANVQLLTSSKHLNVLDGKIAHQQYVGINEYLSDKIDKVTEFTIGGEKVFVKFNSPLLFNFGSNAFHFMKAIQKLDHTFDEINKNNMTKLLGKTVEGNANITFSSVDEIDIDKEKEKFDENSLVYKYLNDNTNSLEDRHFVLQLALQTAQIFNHGEHLKNAKDFFAIQSRLILMMDKMGIAVSFNCKSGKDRTGMCNISIGLILSLTKKNNGIVPMPYQEFDIDDQRIALSIAEKSQSIEIAQANTGVCGLNLSNPKNLFADSNSRLYGDMRGAFYIP